MKVIIFGATGMIGQGVVRECLQNPIVSMVLIIGRTSTKLKHPKIREIILPDLFNYKTIEDSLRGFDACYFCLGVSSAGMKEADYYHMTYELALAAGKTIARMSPLITFIYVSGEGTDSTETGHSMWGRVKGKTENELFKIFRNAYMFRPGMIQPMYGAVSKTKSYRIIYGILNPFMPFLHKLFPKRITTTEKVGRAMIKVTKSGYEKKILTNMDINSASASL